ncbi:unnamed protein product [Ectocarpus sp. 6 AP-2014]
MPSRNIIPKQGNAKALRAKRKREPQVHENAKTAIIIKGRKTSQDVTDALKDIYRLKSPDAVMFSKKNDTNPMEDETSAEFLMSKNDCSLFCFGSHNKKRPNNVVLGRTFDGHMLDMIELGLVQYRGLGELAGLAKRVGSKPAFVFSGEKWGREEAYRKLQNLLLDFFRGQVVNEVALAGLDHCVVCTAAQDKVYVRHYHIGFQRSGSKIPAVDLKEMGPSLDLQIRRTSFAAKDLWKASVKKPRVAETRKTKNVSANQFGDKLGRIHLGRQDLSSMKVRRVKALRTVGKGAKEGEGEGAEDGGGGDPMDGITTSGTGSTSAEGMGDGEGGATAAARAKRGTRRKNKERKVL